MVLPSRYSSFTLLVSAFLLLAPGPAPVQAGQSGGFRKVRDAPPVYPEQAQQAGIQGTVMLRITVGTDGRVTDARVIRSIPELDEAALAAVRQWVYDASTLRRPFSLRVQVPFVLPNAAPTPSQRPRPPTSPLTAATRPAATLASLCAAARPPVVPPVQPTVALPPEQAIQLEIRQLSARIGSGSLSAQGCRDALRRRGYLYATSGAGGLARRDLDALIALEPDDRDAHFFKGLSNFVGGARLALPSFTRVIELRPDDVEAYRARGWANLVETHYKEAISDFDDVLRLAPGDSDAHRGRAWGLIHAGDYVRAIADLDALLKDSGLQPEAVALRGATYYLAGREAEARQALRTAMRLRPRPNGARTYNTVSIDNWRRFRELQRLLEARAKQNPRDVIGWLASGAVQHSAIADRRASGGVGSDPFKVALSIDPTNIDALMMRAASNFAPFAAFRPANALADLTEVIRLDPDYVEAYFQRALVYATDKPSLPLAIADCEKALSLVPSSPLLRSTLEKLKSDQVAWEAEKQRVAELRALRAEEQKRVQEGAAALFFTFLMVQAATWEPPTHEQLRDRQRQTLLDWEFDLATERRR
jgi:TonB family protein